jgi:ribose 5-phosphate isomerase B
MKQRLVAWLRERGHDVEDLGSHDDAEVDYPPLCAEVGRQVADGRRDWGIVVGGSGQGEVIACNKVPGVRAGLCHTRFATEISRGNNDANVMVLGAKVVSPEVSEEMAATWLATPFKGGRHQRRVDQISALERGEPLP